MTDEERRAAPDSLKGKIEGFLHVDDEPASGEPMLESDAGVDVDDPSDWPPEVLPKRPTDPPF